jgi:hypothetical protein
MAQEFLVRIVFNSSSGFNKKSALKLPVGILFNSDVPAWEDPLSWRVLFCIQNPILYYRVWADPAGSLPGALRTGISRFWVNFKPKCCTVLIKSMLLKKNRKQNVQYCPNKTDVFEEKPRGSWSVFSSILNLDNKKSIRMRPGAPGRYS